MKYQKLILMSLLSVSTSVASAATFVIEKYGMGYSIDGNGGAIEGQQIYLWPTNLKNANQQWVQLDRGNGFYSYKKQNTNLCWDGGSGGANRQAITLQTCDANDLDQQFSKVKIYAGTEIYRIKKRGVSYSVDSGNAASQRQPIYLYKSADSNVNQHWEFKSIADSNSSSSVSSVSSSKSSTISSVKSSSNSSVQSSSASSVQSSSSSSIPSGNAQIPSDLMRNCKQWKITYPTGVEDKTLCGEYNNEYFKVNNSGNGIVFFAPVRSNNGTTPNSSYIRSELRERTADGSADVYWTTSGTHAIYVKQAITHLPITKPHLVATQIHGNKDAGIDDAMVLRLENQKLFLSFNGGKLRSDLTIKTNYTLGKVHEVIFEVIDGKHYVYYSEDGKLAAAYASGNASAYLVKDGANSYVMNKSYGEAYFKVGNYTQSNSDVEGSNTNKPDNYGEVVVYDFWVSHK